MKLTEKEEKIARLALDKGAQNGERQAAAIKFIESMYARGVKVEDLEGTETVYREINREVPVYMTPEPPKNTWKNFLTNLKITTAIGVVWVALAAISAAPHLHIPAQSPSVSAYQAEAQTEADEIHKKWVQETVDKELARLTSPKKAPAPTPEFHTLTLDEMAAYWK